METIELSQEELKILVTVLSQINLRLPDATIVLPVFEKIRVKLKVEENVENKPEDKVTEDKAN